MASNILGIIERLRKIENVWSGVMQAQSSCEMPKTNKQVCHKKREFNALSSFDETDTHESHEFLHHEKVQRDIHSAVICFVEATAKPNSMCVLVINQ